MFLATLWVHAHPFQFSGKDQNSEGQKQGSQVLNSLRLEIDVVPPAILLWNYTYIPHLFGDCDFFSLSKTLSKIFIENERKKRKEIIRFKLS